MSRYPLGKTRIIDAFQRNLDEIEKRWPMSASYERVDPYIVPYIQAGRYFELLIYHVESKIWFDSAGYDDIVHKIINYNLIKEGDVVFDLGSNAGTVAIVMASLVGEPGHVHAFDPYPWNAAATECNARLNYFHNVTAHAVGISNKDFRIKVLPTDSRITDSSYAESAQELTIKSIKNFTYLRPKFLKIDIEGAEFDLFQDADPRLFASVRYFVCEYHPNWISMRDLDPKQGLRSMRDSGFTLHCHDLGAPAYDPEGYSDSHQLFWGARDAEPVAP